MTDERLAELERLCEEATPGPWEWSRPHECPSGQYVIRAPNEPNHCGTFGRMIALLTWADHPTGKFIAASRTAIPKLIEEVRRLRNVIDQHNLCHDLHGKVDVDGFAAGCAAEIKEHYSRCPWEEKIAEQQAELDRLRPYAARIG